MNRLSCSIAFVLLLCSFVVPAQAFLTNPLLPSGADPWVIYKDGFYYYTHTTGRNIVLYKTANLADLHTAEHKTVWEPPDSTLYSKQVWAPELHYLRGKWYFYFAADDGLNEHHRIYVLENASADPFTGTWVFRGKVADPSDKWAIDASVFTYRKKLYMVWSGWQGDQNGQQDLYIARMRRPWKIRGRRVRISSPVYEWETHGDLNDPGNPPHVSVNEGPQVLRHNDKLFIVYSASGCWTDHYGLGLLTFTGKRNLLDSSAWVKAAQPVFSTSVENSVFAPGHNSFFRSPDGREDWILYHANDEAGQGCGRMRSPRAQKFSWNDDGTPFFGTPVRRGVPLPAPTHQSENVTLK